LQQLLQSLGFKEKRTETARLFHHPKEGLIVFRVYDEDESVDPGDLLSTRRFLDMRGVLDGGDFDALVHRATPA
jgi:hypothetical protein